METTPTGTSLEVLAPFLPYGIEVQHTGTVNGKHFSRELLALSYRHKSVQIENTWWVDPEQVLPILFPFSALCTPLPSGEIPLYEYVRFMWPKEKDMYHREYGDIIEVHGSTALYMMKRSDFEAGSLHRLGALYLQKLHFACGLNPSQFIAKQPLPCPRPTPNSPSAL